MTTRSNIITEIEQIKARNKRVEADKAWEISVTRRVFVSVTTYVLVVVLMIVLGVEQPLIAAIIPAVAYLISTLSMGILKSWWLNNRK